MRYSFSAANPIPCVMFALVLTFTLTGALRAEETWSAGPPPEIAGSDNPASTGDEGAAGVRDITVEGEDQIQIEFERPSLKLDLEAARLTGLEMMDIIDILERSDVDLVGPMVAQSTNYRSPYLGHPWLRCFSPSPVARFHPALDGVDRWRLTIADSQGKTVAEFRGSGRPPEEIAWDGISLGGTPAPPGLTYSYVLEAYDRAGNKRNFVGDGFQLPAYRVETGDSLFLLLAGEELPPTMLSSRQVTETPPILLEAASWINQSPRVESPVRVTVTARTFDQAQALAQAVTENLKSHLLGDPLRIRPVTNVEPGAPERGTIVVAAAR